MTLSELIEAVNATIKFIKPNNAGPGVVKKLDPKAANDLLKANRITNVKMITPQPNKPLIMPVLLQRGRTYQIAAGADVMMSIAKLNLPVEVYILAQQPQAPGATTSMKTPTAAQPAAQQPKAGAPIGNQNAATGRSAPAGSVAQNFKAGGDAAKNLGSKITGFRDRILGTGFN